MRNVLRLFGAALAVLVFATGAKAAPIVGVGDPLTNAALVGGTQEGFDAVASGLYASITLGNVTYSGVGDPLTIGTDFNGSFNTFGGKSLFNDFDLVPDQMRFDFGTAVNAFAFNWGAADNTWTLQAFDSGGGLLETFIVPAVFGSNAGEYYGIAVAGIKWAILTDNKNNIASGDYVFVDRFTSSGAAVPEPVTLMLLGSGLVGLAARRRWARR